MDLTIVNSTFSNNTASAGSLISLFDHDSKIKIGYTTFFGNDSLSNEGIIKLTYFAPTELYIENSIFANNTGGECILNGFSANLTNNLSNDGTCGSVVAINIHSILQNNGGSTKTHKLLSGSNAIDSALLINPLGLKFKCPRFDQRGVTRPFDGNSDGVAKCDIGAYELNKIVLLPAPVERASKEKPEPATINKR